MADLTNHIKHQSSYRIPNGNIVVTIVELQSASDTVDVPRLSSATGTAAQLRRPGDNAVTVTISDIDTVALAGAVGDIVTIVSHHGDPIPTPASG